jgi:epoxide hydrolase 4
MDSSDSVQTVALHSVTAGDPASPRPPVVLLHGFPEFSYAWRRQLPALADAGFHAIAPDLRGYNLSPRPPRVRDYPIELLAADVLALIRETRHPRASVVGHDWGGVVAWWLAMHHPEAVERLVILNAPHPAAYLREVRRPAQLLRSWYAFLFQLPRLPEALIRANDFALLRSVYCGSAFMPEDISRYVEGFARPGALTAALNYYRAAFRQGPGHAGRSVRRIEAPTLLIWGERDRYLVPELTEGLEQWVSNLRVERLPNASHWLHHEDPERVNRLLVEFLSAG